MTRFEVENNYGQLAQTIENHYPGGRMPPPEGDPNSRTCPQCGNSTWRMTQWCVHCGADLFAIDARERERRVARKSLKVAGTLLAIGGAAFYAQFHVPPSARLWVMGIAAFSIFLAAAVLR
jgi:hypothetical protein